MPEMVTCTRSAW